MHGILQRCFRRAIALAVAVVLSAAVVVAGPMVRDEGDASTAVVRAKITKYFASDEWTVRKTTFTGRFLEIPKELELPLAGTYPRWRFTIVEMSMDLDISHMNVKLIVLSDAKTGSVEGYAYELGRDMSPRFAQVLKGEIARSEQDAVDRLAILAMLFLSTADGSTWTVLQPRLGAAWWDRTSIHVEMIGMYAPFAELTMPYDENLRLGVVSNVEPRQPFAREP